MPTRLMPALGEIVRQFKAISTIHIRANGLPKFAWQPNYYEHIIRNDHSLERIREYIAGNPSKWTDDKENPNRIATSH